MCLPAVSCPASGAMRRPTGSSASGCEENARKEPCYTLPRTDDVISALHSLTPSSFTMETPSPASIAAATPRPSHWRPSTHTT